MNHYCANCPQCNSGCHLCGRCKCYVVVSTPTHRYNVNIVDVFQNTHLLPSNELEPTPSKEDRESFFKRLEPFFPPSTMRDLKLAYILAKHGHRAQFRKEVDEKGKQVRYFEHVRRVALILFDEAKCVRPEMLIAALLHDGIEDTRDLTADMIEHVFDADVTSIIMTLSKTPKEGYIDRFMLCNDWRPYVIKACDRLDNLRSLRHEGVTPEFREKQIKETREKYIPLFNRMIELTPKRCKQRAITLLDKIDEELNQLEIDFKLIAFHDQV